MQSVAADNKAKVRRLRGRSLARSLASAAGRTKTARAIERLVKEVLKERESLLAVETQSPKSSAVLMPSLLRAGWLKQKRTQESSRMKDERALNASNCKLKHLLRPNATQLSAPLR